MRFRMINNKLFQLNDDGSLTDVVVMQKGVNFLKEIRKNVETDVKDEKEWKIKNPNKPYIKPIEKVKDISKELLKKELKVTEVEELSKKKRGRKKKES